MSFRVFVEGGGSGSDSKGRKSGRSEQNITFREGFSSFVRKAGLDGRMPRFIRCGSRESAFRDFKRAVREGEDAMLLVDAEEPVKAHGPWQHLQSSDSWSRPTGATNDQCHLMVQVMESWFLADPDALKSFYGRDFREGSLRRSQNIEQIPKQDVERRLKHATRETRKGDYFNNKGNHSFAILAQLDPAKVRCKSRYAERFFSELERRSQE